MKTGFRLTPLLILALLTLALNPGLRAQDDPFYRKQATWPDTLLATRAALAQAGQTDPALALNLWLQFEKDFPIACDWMQQDAGPLCGRWLVDPAPGKTLKQMMTKVFAELGASSPVLAARYRGVLGAPALDMREALALYLEACAARRTLRLGSLQRTAPRIVFTKHFNMGAWHYAMTEGQSDAQGERSFVPGSALCVLTLDGIYGRVETLLEDPFGVIRDPEVSRDGRRILFAWKKSDLLDDYHLYEMEVESRAVRQLTAGRGVADYEGIWLPDGSILFNSTRCVQMLPCYRAEVSNLYACNADGSAIRRLTYDQAHDNYPTLAPDGRVLYTRWEFNDRGQMFLQPLFQMNPDGTGQGEFYGNNSTFPTSILHARAIPGTGRVLAVAAGHFCRQAGKLIVIDPARGRQEKAGIEVVAGAELIPPARPGTDGQKGELFQYPYPLGEEDCLVAYHPTGWLPPDLQVRLAPNRVVPALYPRFGIYYMKLDGRRELLAWDSALPCNQPMPLAARRPAHRRPSMVNPAAAEGACYIQDVHAGPGLAGVARGTVKALRVVALDYRTASVGLNYNDGSSVYTPIAIGNGSWDVKKVLGQARVYEDGSAYFKVPARVPVYFQLLDEKGRLVQTMRSWTALQPGENASCAGCHEHKNSTPLERGTFTQAHRAGPQPLEPFYGPARGFSFAREVQPILDRHCIACHDGAKHVLNLTGAAAPDLETAQRTWSEAYWGLLEPQFLGCVFGEVLRARASGKLVHWVGAQSPPELLRPRAAGSGRSRLLELLDAGHQGIRLGREELDRIACWIDLGVPFCGDYAEGQVWSEGELRVNKVYQAKRESYGGAGRDTATGEKDDYRLLLTWVAKPEATPSLSDGIKLEFGRAVQIDRIRVVRSGGARTAGEVRIGLEYPDGRRDQLQMAAGETGRDFPIRPCTVEWVKLAGVEPGAVREAAVWGRESAADEMLMADRVAYAGCKE